MEKLTSENLQGTALWIRVAQAMGENKPYDYYKNYSDSMYREGRWTIEEVVSHEYPLPHHHDIQDVKLRSVIESKSGSPNAESYWDAISADMEEKSASQCRHRWKTLTRKKNTSANTIEPIWSKNMVIVMMSDILCIVM